MFKNCIKLSQISTSPLQCWSSWFSTFL